MPPAPSLLIPLIVAFGFFMESLDSTVLVTSIPAIARSFGDSPLHLKAAVTSYLLSLAVFIPLSGWVADRFGTRNVFCAAIALFTLGSALCGLSNDLTMLIAARVLQGMGGAMMNPVGRLIVLRAFPKDQLLVATTYMILPGLIGPAVGPLVGGFFSTYVSWRWIFYINLPIGAAGLILSWLRIRNIRADVVPRFDARGFLLLAGGLAALQIAVEQLGRSGTTAVATTLFGTATLLLLIYGWHARRRKDPPIDLRLFRIRTFAFAILGGSFAKIGMGGIPLMLPLFFQLGFGLTPMESGSLTFVSSFGAVLMKPIQPRVLRRVGFRWALILNSIVLAVMATGIGGFTADTPHWAILGYLFCFGVIRSLQNGANNGLGYSDLMPEVMSKGSTIVAVSQQLTQCLGMACSITILTAFIGSHALPVAADFRPVFFVIGLFPLASSLLFLRLHPADGAAVSGHRATVI